MQAVTALKEPSEPRTGAVALPVASGTDFHERIRDYNLAVERCSRCLFDVNTPHISFDSDGVCNYCKVCDQLEEDYPNDRQGELILEQMVDEIKQAGRGKPFDLVIGVSGGCDSSWLVAKAVDWGLRPLAAHYDNTWNSTIATQNIHAVLDKLGVELFTYVVDNEECNDICRAFIRAGVIDIETPTDIGLATTLYMAAARHGIRYQFEGHSFRTEGVGPLGWFYMDGKYIESVVKQYGNYRDHRLKSFPNLTFARFMRYSALNRMKKVRPIYWMDYHKEEAKEWLQQEFGWQWYGGHHLENRFTAFLHSYYAPRRFGLDTRVVGHSALVRSGQISREEGLKLLLEPFHYDDEVTDIVKRRLGFSDEEFEEIMLQPRRTYRDFRTYKKRFERLRPMFYLMAKAQLVPMSF
ncbi:MAG: N-acetyl sugar amidotransferase [Gammaproteobacteria bacterium]|nr:N-acetyl sugar amidotransferase [Gammaproteobacteria bacterium]